MFVAHSPGSVGATRWVSGRHPLGRRRRSPAACRIEAWAVGVVCWIAVIGGHAVAAPLTGRDTLTRAYEAILNADFTAASEQLRRCDGAPPVACQVLDATSLWWRIQLNPYDRSLDAPFSTRVDQAIAAAEAWVAREPARAEAWFYLGGAYGARVQFRVLRTERLAAARDGKRIKDALEAALRLDPSLEDANFGVGLYQYYADVAPAAAKFLRWLLLLPGGNKVEGLARMIRAADRGDLLRSEAAFQLHIVYLWYEHDFPGALERIAQLDARYPANPLFPQIAAEIHDIYLHDPTSSAGQYERLLRRTQAGGINEPRLAEFQARLGLANQLDALFESDRALEHARTVLAAKATVPYGAVSAAHLAAGRALMRLGQEVEGRASLDRAVALAPAGDPYRIAERARATRRLRVDAQTAAGYRAALDGYRAYQRRDYAAAEAALSRAVAMNPRDPVTRFRYGLLWRARGDTARARQEWELVAGAGATAPPAIFAEACVALAGLIERAGDVARARQLYQRAAATFGASADTRGAATRQAARLAGSSGPSR